MVSSTTWRQAGGGRTPGPACSARRQSPKLPAVGCPCPRHGSCFPFCSSVLCFDSATRPVGSLALAAAGMNHERDGGAIARSDFLESFTCMPFACY
jgi:hypothetical protein